MLVAGTAPSDEYELQTAAVVDWFTPASDRPLRGHAADPLPQVVRIRSVVASDSEGSEPRAPKPLEELLGDELLDGRGAKLDRNEALAGKHLALYFSAHWCPASKRFTPELATTYAAIKARRNDVEFVFVSGDHDSKSFDAHYKEMPWLALPLDAARYQALSSHFEVDGIPTLVVLSPEGKFITTKGREVASQDPEGIDFPWHPQPCTSLAFVESNRLATGVTLTVPARGARERQRAA